MSNPIGIEYKIFEYRGNQKKQIMDFRSAPGNLKTGLDVMREKLGITNDRTFIESVQKNAKTIARGKRL